MGIICNPLIAVTTILTYFGQASIRVLVIPTKKIKGDNFLPEGTWNVDNNNN